MENITTSMPNMAPTPLPSDARSAIVNNDILNVEITNENIALNVMVSFLNVAQKRGAYSFDESAKIWECIQKFIAREPTVSPATPSFN